MGHGVSTSTRVQICKAGPVPIDPANFDSEPELYQSIRPTYPELLFDALFDTLPPSPNVIEVGPGTGQATLPMLQRGANITAVELGAGLTHVLERRAAELTEPGTGELGVVIGDFEAVDLPLNSADAVVSATAYHWISAAGKVGRPAQLLGPNGVLAVIDTNQITDPADQGYFDNHKLNEIYNSYGQGRTKIPPTEHELVPAIADVMRADTRCRDVTVTAVRRDETYTCEQYDKLLRTFSGPQSLTEPDRTTMIDALCAIARDEFGGSVTRPLVFTLTTARISA